MGFRAGRSIEDAVVTVTEAVEAAHRQGQRAVLIALDLAAAFPNIRRDVLVRELKHAGVSVEMARWCSSFMEERTANIVLDGHHSPQMPAVGVGAPQGSPISPILLNYYAARLVKALAAEGLLAVWFADDGSILVTGKTLAEIADRANRALALCSAWAIDLGAAFEPAKAQLMLFHTTKKKPETVLPRIEMNGVAIERTATIKALGIILDEKLQYHEHVRARVAKAMAVLGQIAGLTRCSRGAGARSMRTLIVSTVLPVLTFGSAVWFVPGRRGMQQLLDMMQPVMKKAAKLVSGGYRTASRAALEVEADLMPVELQLQKLSFAFAARCRALPPSHPLSRRATDAIASIRRGNDARPHCGHLERLLRQFPSLHPTIETIFPVPAAPWSRGEMATVQVAKSREEGIALVQQLVEAKTSSQIITFSDGSTLNPAQKGCAFVRFDPPPLGVDRPSYIAHGFAAGAAFITVYELELIGIAKALDAVRRAVAEDAALKEAILFVDNQSALKAALDPRKGSGQYISYDAWRTVEAIRAIRPGFAIRLVWSPAHDGIDGNELADHHAKLAAQFKRSDESEPLPDRVHPLEGGASSFATSSPPPSRASAQSLPPALVAAISDIDPPRSVSALKTAFAAGLQERWTAEWAESNEGEYTRRLDPSPPSRKHRRRHHDLGRRGSSVLTQVRTGFNPLNFSLRKVGLRTSPVCEHCEAGVPETLEHFALDCRAFAPQRRVLQRALPRRHRTDVRHMVTDDAAIRKFLRFVFDTGRFARYYESPKTRPGAQATS